MSIAGGHSGAGAGASGRSARRGLSGTTVGEWWARWYPAVDLAPSTLEAYAQQYRRHVGPRFGRVRLDEVTALGLSQFARRLREQGLAPSSVALAMSVIHDLLVDAAAEGLIAAAPAARVRQRRAGQGRPLRVGVAVGLRTVLAVGERLPAQEALMVIVAAFTGMRWGEVCAMRTGTLRLLLFANRSGEPIRHTDFLRLWRRACDGRPARYARDGSELEPATAPVHRGLRFHDLRHTHKTMLTELGVPEILQDERLGHHPPGMRGVYAHTTSHMREAMVEGLQELWEHERHGEHHRPA